MLKWALVDQGESIRQADEIVRKANWISAPLLAIGSLLAFSKSKRLLGSTMTLLAGISFLVAKGYIKETAGKH